MHLFQKFTWTMNPKQMIGMITTGNHLLQYLTHYSFYPFWTPTMVFHRDDICECQKIYTFKI